MYNHISLVWLSFTQVAHTTYKHTIPTFINPFNICVSFHADSTTFSSALSPWKPASNRCTARSFTFTRPSFTERTAIGISLRRTGSEIPTNCRAPGPKRGRRAMPKGENDYRVSETVLNHWQCVMCIWFAKIDIIKSHTLCDDWRRGGVGNKTKIYKTQTKTKNEMFAQQEM